MSNSASQGLYSPLPQSISDTDSEEELHSSMPRNLNDKKMNGEMKDYHHLDESEDGHINGFPNVNCHTLDDVPIIKDGYKQPMSALRKFFFVLSILICFLTIIIFLWVLPCADDQTCAVTIPKHHSSSWEKAYHGIELMGPINIVNGVPGHCKNLVFLFRGDVTDANTISKQELPNIPPRGGGAISIMGDSGKVAWYIPRQRIPSHIDCALLDVDKNGEDDCLITGEKGLFEAINPLSGEVHWNIHIHPKNSSLFTSIDFPLVILDVNDDHVHDLLTACSIQNSNHNIIIIISGRMGNVLGKPYILSNCDGVDSLILEKTDLSYYCEKGHKRSKYYLQLRELYSKSLNKTYIEHYVPFIKQYYKWDTKKMLRNNFYVNGKKLLISNQGHCPGSCSVSVQLIDSKGDKDNLTWSYTGHNMYGMIPTKLNFKNSQNNLDLQGHVNGYILKFWQWTDSKNNNVYTPNYIVNKSKRNIFDDLTIKAPWYIAREERSIPLDKSKNYTEVLLEERVMLLTYNATNYKTVNASQSDIRQLCIINSERHFCQPDLASQENSVLLVDLDGDGSQELISYLSSFIPAEDSTENNTKYLLQTVVKVIRLEKELPKLYESVTKY